MSVIVFASGKGSTGVTALSAATAARWSDRPGKASRRGGGPFPLLVEADPAGGDLAARFGLAPRPGLANAAGQARHHLDPHAAVGHSQRLPFGVDVLLAPAGHAPATAAVALTAATGLPAAIGAIRPVIVDVGRLDASSPAWPIAVAADVVVVLARPHLAELSHTADLVRELRTASGVSVRLVLRGGGPIPAAEIARDLGVAVLMQQRDDRWGAAVMSGRASPSLGWTRLGLVRDGRSIALALRKALPQHGAPARSARPGTAQSVTVPRFVGPATEGVGRR